MPTPSLLIVPARFKTGKLYSQIPTSGAGDFTVTRNTEARRFDSAGLIASVASGIPRLDYYTSGGVTGCPALLVEPAATNLAFNSQTWASANNWGLDGVTIATATSGTTAPDGTSTANAISPTSGNIAHICFSNQPTLITFVSGTIYTQSAFFKQGTGVAGRYVQLTFGGSRFAQAGYANFDLQVGAVTASGGTADPNRNARIENYGNGWYRCSFTATCTSNGDTNGVDPILITTSGATRAPSFSGTVTDVLYGWGAQLETGSVATSYIPTTAGTGSRSADTISVTGAVSGSIGQTEGTLYLEMQADAAGNGTAILTLGGASSNNYLYIGKDAGVLRVRLQIGSPSSVFNNGATVLNGSVLKVAVAYQQSGNCAAYVNGSFLVSGTAANNFNAALTGLGFSDQVTFPMNTISAINRIRAAALYTTRLTNAELAALTAP